MPSLLEITRQALGGEDLKHCESRSLRLTRYAQPELSAEPRRDYLAAITRAQSDPTAARAARAWQATIPGASTLHARLEARLLLHLSGSVLENAGLGLDRYGVVPLPGSALKGCARRAALATLRQWCESGDKPAADDSLADGAAPFAHPEDLLVAILRVFGCTDLEWQDFDARKGSGNDLAWACAAGHPGDRWSTCRSAALAALTNAPDQPAAGTPTLRGAIAFLAAQPTKRPTPDLELDVLTSHHPKYYQSSDPGAIALDNEAPIPVLFPAVAADTEYCFTLVPVGTHGTPALLEHASVWLRIGLTTFGLGGKTAAGYGWFKDVTADVRDREAKEAEQRRKAAEQAAADKHLAEERAAHRAREARLQAMNPVERAQAELAERATNWGSMKQHLMKFPSLKDPEKVAILHWFAGAGRNRWRDEIVAGRAKKPWSQIIGSIEQAKKHFQIDLP
jgi:CRISPR-associated protein Cmr6